MCRTGNETPPWSEHSVQNTRGPLIEKNDHRCVGITGNEGEHMVEQEGQAGDICTALVYITSA